MNRLFLIAALLAPPSAAATTDPVAQARLEYDLPGARELLSSLAAESGEPSAIEQEVRAALLVAELERIDFENTPTRDGEVRRRTGTRIDEAARRGLELLDQLDETSHTLRLRADLIGTLIRSKFRGKRYRAQMDRAAARAIELDPGNAQAHTSAAKPSLLRPGRDRNDLEAGLVIIERALAIDPDLETALLLRGRALWELDRKEQARQDWQQALTNNPTCHPAATWLETPPP